MLFTLHTLSNGLIVAACLQCSAWIVASPKVAFLQIAQRCHKCSHARSH